MGTSAALLVVPVSGARTVPVRNLFIVNVLSLPVRASTFVSLIAAFVIHAILFNFIVFAAAFCIAGITPLSGGVLHDW